MTLTNLSQRRANLRVVQAPAHPLVIGAGLAGLTVALDLAERGIPVTLVSGGPLGTDCSSDLAQGGLAAAVAAGDSPEAHALDTLAAGAGLCDPDTVARVTAAAPGVVDRLVRLGAEVERTASGVIALGLEGGHGARRIVHAGGDASGHLFTAALIAAVRANPLVTVAEGTWVDRLLTSEGGVVGALARVRTRRGTAQVVLPSRHVVLATGGLGSLFGATTNPRGSHGSGIALGIRAGAVARDLELVQFHPTALDVGLDPMPLVSEAVRGEGAHLVLADGTRILDNDLATRDIVARAVFAHVNAGRQVYLDTATALGDDFPVEFPTVTAACLAAGIDPTRELVPIRPAAHYHMGGLLTDATGRTTVPGLWASGEVASTGLHGANRLASNSLLEAIAYGPWIADDIASGLSTATGRGLQTRAVEAAAAVELPALAATADEARARRAYTRRVLDTHVGVLRDASGLTTALTMLAPGCTGADDRLVATLLALGALRREESRGGHSRTDFPALSEPAHTLLSLTDAVELDHSSAQTQPHRSAS
ncbi:MAG: L-aspartate oxidase [Dermatophilus congolensis]|nr:L-aspartate oxidase [Dermatophilus congolensis]